jgi:hypothetical protein
MSNNSSQICLAELASKTANLIVWTRAAATIRCVVLATQNGKLIHSANVPR